MFTLHTISIYSEHKSLSAARKTANKFPEQITIIIKKDNEFIDKRENGFWLNRKNRNYGKPIPKSSYLSQY